MVKIKKNYIYIGIIFVVILGLFYWSSQRGPQNILDYNLREHKNLALHIHPNLEIEILGEPYPIPANLGVSERGMSVIHTHKDDGNLHTESPADIRQ